MCISYLALWSVYDTPNANTDIYMAFYRYQILPKWYGVTELEAEWYILITHYIITGYHIYCDSVKWKIQSVIILCVIYKVDNNLETTML